MEHDPQLELELDKTTANTSKRGKRATNTSVGNHRHHQEQHEQDHYQRCTPTRSLSGNSFPQTLTVATDTVLLALELPNVILCDSDVMHNLCHHHLKIDAHLVVVVFDLGSKRLVSCEMGCAELFTIIMSKLPMLPKRATAVVKAGWSPCWKAVSGNPLVGTVADEQHSSTTRAAKSVSRWLSEYQDLHKNTRRRSFTGSTRP